MACADFSRLGRVVKILESAKVEALHFDFCDGHFAPTFVFSCSILASVRSLSTRRFDAHLYCEYPSRYMDELADCGTDLVIVQVESKENYQGAIKKIREKGMKAGVGILPDTSIPAGIQEILPEVSLIIANTVGPAYSGQPFDRRGLRNMKQLGEIIGKHGYRTDVGADGGVELETLDTLLDAGANFFICGSKSIFRADLDLVKGVETFRKEVESRARRC